MLELVQVVVMAPYIKPSIRAARKMLLLLLLLLSTSMAKIMKSLPLANVSICS